MRNLSLTLMICFGVVSGCTSYSNKRSVRDSDSNATLALGAVETVDQALQAIANAEQELRVIHEKLAEGAKGIQDLQEQLRKAPRACTAHREITKKIIEAQFDFHDKFAKREILVKNFEVLASKYRTLYPVGSAARASISAALTRSFAKIANYFIGIGGTSRIAGVSSRLVLGALSGPVGAYLSLGCSNVNAYEPMRYLRMPEGTDPVLFCHGKRSEFLAVAESNLQRYGTTRTCSYGDNIELSRNLMLEAELKATVELCYSGYHLLHPDLIDNPDSNTVEELLYCDGEPSIGAPSNPQTNYSPSTDDSAYDDGDYPGPFSESTPSNGSSNSDDPSYDYMTDDY